LVFAAISSRFFHRADHALARFRQDDFGSVRTQDVAPFDAHVFGHDDDAAVATHRGDHGEADARVAARGFDDRGSFAQSAVAFALKNHA